MSDFMLMHSGCPGKVNIHAPYFKRIDEETMHTPKGDVVKYQCQGCQTIVFAYYVAPKAVV